MIENCLNHASPPKSDQVPHGGDEVPVGTFHGGDEVPVGTFH